MLWTIRLTNKSLNLIVDKSLQGKAPLELMANKMSSGLIFIGYTSRKAVG